MTRIEELRAMVAAAGEERLAMSDSGYGVIYVLPVENDDSAVAVPVRDKNMGWHKANPEVYAALVNRFNEFPTLATELAAALAREAALREALNGVLNACDQGRMVPVGAGGMTIEANIRGSVYHGVPAWPIEEARDKLAALGAQP